MLTIRQEQVEALVQARWDDFYERARTDVRRDWPDQTDRIPEDQLRARFYSARARSHKFGLRTELQIERIFVCSVLLGDSFEDQDEYRWAKEILESRRMTANDRAMLVVETVKTLVHDGDQHV